MEFTSVYVRFTLMQLEQSRKTLFKKSRTMFRIIWNIKLGEQKQDLYTSGIFKTKSSVTQFVERSTSRNTR